MSFPSRLEKTENPTFDLLMQAGREAYSLYCHLSHEHTRNTLLYHDAYYMFISRAISKFRDDNTLYSNENALAEFDDCVRKRAENMEILVQNFDDRFLTQWRRDTRPLETDPEYTRTIRYYIEQMPFNPTYDDVFVDQKFVRKGAEGLECHDPVTNTWSPVPNADQIFFVRRELYLPLEVPPRRGASLQTLAKRSLVDKPETMTAREWERIRYF